MRTQLSAWQVKNQQESSGNMNYVELKHTTPAHIANDVATYRISLPEGIDGMMIKTIRVVSEQNIAFVVGLMDGNTNESIYESLEELKFHYDQVDIPYKPSDKTVYVRIHNRGNVTTKFTINIRGVEVK